MSREKIEEMVEYLNNTINVERNSYFGKGCITMPIIEADKILDILKSYRKQSENVIELPCNVGDTVYYIKGGYYKKPEFCEVSRPCKVVEVSLKLQRNKSRVMQGFITDNGTRYDFNSIGKTVFLTREEAEKALAKRKGGAE